MSNTSKFAGALLAFVVIAIGMILWFRTTRSLRADLEWQRAYSQVTGGKIVAEIREIMGQDEDKSDHRTTAEGEFEKSGRLKKVGFELLLSSIKKVNPSTKNLVQAFVALRP